MNAVQFLVTFDRCSVLGCVLYVLIALGSLKGRRGKKEITLGRKMRLANGVGIAEHGLCENFQAKYGPFWTTHTFAMISFLLLLLFFELP
jgi:hypothetical protein